MQLYSITIQSKQNNNKHNNVRNHLIFFFVFVYRQIEIVRSAARKCDR